ncbi:reticulocyte-binding protein homolog 1-like isoform X1 [Linepithema humile]|uniref:reticulocyte-binding protein homolog 1-like isoform X1 n=1 Tax=Linepithema humile TaxID=83485 RepID=UPI00351EB2FA
MYYIIFYDDWCSTIPQQWVNFNTQTFLWPPKTINVTKAIMKSIQPQNNWITLDYRRITGPYKTYDIARKMEDHAIYVSTSEEGQLEILNQQPEKNPQKRTIKRPAFHDELDDTTNEHTTKKRRRIPPPSSAYISLSEQRKQYPNNRKQDKHLSKNIAAVASCSTYILASNEMNNYKKQNENINSVIVLPSTCETEELGGVHSVCDVNDVNNDIHEVYDAHDINEIYNVNDVNDIHDMSDIHDINAEVDNDDDVNDVNDVNDVHDVNVVNDSHICCEACRTTLKTFTQKFTTNTIRIAKKLDFIINLIENKDVACESTLKCDTKLLPPLPLMTIEDYSKFEEKLQQDREIRKQFKKKISTIGGTTYANKTRNIMKFILDDNVSKKLSWTGQKQSIPIKDTTFASIIIDYISTIENCSLYQVQKVIQEWLRHAGDRLSYLLKKNGMV